MDKFKNYIDDSLEILIERAEEARNKALKTEADFEKGIAMGYYHALSFLLGQAVNFSISNDLKECVRDYVPVY